MEIETSAEKVIYMRKFMNERPSRFFYEDEMDMKKEYKFRDYEEKTLAVINGEVDTLSDCYILYAISVLGCADIQTISEFLQTLKKYNPTLNLPDYNKDVLKSRLRALKKYGFLFNVLYKIPCGISEGATTYDNSHCSLFTAGKDAVYIMNARLRKREKHNAWLEHKPIDELIGMASAAACFTRFIQSPYFVKLGDGIFKGRYCGTVRLDGELITQTSDVSYYIGILSLYLHKHPDFMTDKDYVAIKDFKMNVIKDYLLNRTKKGIPKIILVCENSDDMVRFSKSIMISGAFDNELLSNIHFTSYSLVDSFGKNSSDWFMHMQLDSTSKSGFQYLNSKAFL